MTQIRMIPESRPACLTRTGSLLLRQDLPIEQWSSSILRSLLVLDESTGEGSWGNTNRF
ncbi:MAG: hypothetical protein LBL90_13770 [Prevotellaceae bacterium]|nr:hypothetical protein [Prevotellaceae bacterium]